MDEISANRAATDRGPGRTREERDHAIEFLKKELAEGPVEVRTLEIMAESRSISDMTMKRAAEELGVTKTKVGKTWRRSLPTLSE